MKKYIVDISGEVSVELMASRFILSAEAGAYIFLSEKNGEKETVGIYGANNVVGVRKAETE